MTNNQKELDSEIIAFLLGLCSVDFLVSMVTLKAVLGAAAPDIDEDDAVKCIDEVIDGNIKTSEALEKMSYLEAVIKPLDVPDFIKESVLFTIKQITELISEL